MTNLPTLSVNLLDQLSLNYDFSSLQFSLCPLNLSPFFLALLKLLSNLISFQLLC